VSFSALGSRLLVYATSRAKSYHRIYVLCGIDDIDYPFNGASVHLCPANLKRMTSDLPHRFGRRVASLRKARKLEQHQLGQRVGKGNKFISRIETGQNFPRPEMIDKLAKALQVPVSALFFDEGIDNNPKLMRRSINSFLDASDTKRLRRYFLQMLISLED
jgi:transcriptional regulator with XRE-family HTH domain